MNIILYSVYLVFVLRQKISIFEHFKAITWWRDLIFHISIIVLYMHICMYIETYTYIIIYTILYIIITIIIIYMHIIIKL